MDILKGILYEYTSKGIIVDTNLIILYIVGFYDITYIEKFGRVKNKGYTKEDFLALKKLLESFRSLFLTPQILAEISNLSFNDVSDKRFVAYFDEMLRVITNVNEKYIPKNILVKIPSLIKFGFTDLSIFELAKKENLPVVTDDFKLHGFLSFHGIRSINMDQIRAYS
jgi:hypothetical protein